MISIYLACNEIMAEGTFTQCRLTHGTVYTTAFIPSKFAVAGKQIRVKGKPWTVAEAYETVPATIRNQQHHAADIWDATSGEFAIGHK